ncbi:MAG: sigma-70 family RNA polymerase sigma factor [Planctomycetota bacterium]|nr:sigma-70 family RNA polymerase sigma factor [Planctomycetota bacterium]
MQDRTQEPHPARRRPPAEQMLVDRARTGSLEAFSELVRLYQGRLFNFLRQRTGCASDADDLAQEAFLRAWRSLDRYDPAWRFSTWLFTIASRLAVSHQRAMARRRELPLTGEPERSAADPAELRRVRLRNGNIWALAASNLGDVERAALWLRYAENMPAPEIARIMNRTTVNIRVILHRARQRLARCLPDDESIEIGDAAMSPAAPTETSTTTVPGAHTDV